MTRSTRILAVVVIAAVAGWATLVGIYGFLPAVAFIGGLITGWR